LQNLFLSHTRMTDGGVEDLRTKLPQCKIYR